jgi:hypothetical protein
VIINPSLQLAALQHDIQDTLRTFDSISWRIR